MMMKLFSLKKIKETLKREKINTILYKAYEKMAVKKAIDFKRLHAHKCANIKMEELTFSSKMGLFKSIQKYNGNNSLLNYSSIYIQSELLRLLTETHSLSALPKSVRIKSKDKHSMKKEDLIKYRNKLNVILTAHYEQWQLDTMFINNEEPPTKILENQEQIERINELLHYSNSDSNSSFSKRCIYLKLFFNTNQNQNIVVSNKYISDLMGCSEETVRQELNKLYQ